MPILKYQKVIVAYIALAAIYLLLIFSTRPNETLLSVLHLTLAQAKTLNLLEAIPFLFVWWLAFWAYTGMRSYSEEIKPSSEWRAFNFMAWGLLFGLLFLPISNILNELATFIRDAYPSLFTLYLLGASLLTAFTIIAAFGFTFLGSARLLRLIRTSPRYDYLITSILFICFVGLYVILVVHPPNAQFLPSYSVLTFPSYGSSTLYDVAVILPRIIGWFLGVLAVLNFYQYRTKVQGIFYREAFKRVAQGNAIIITGAIAYRYAQDALIPVSDANFKLTLTLTYLVLISYGVGFALIGNGAQKLHKIEKVNGPGN